MKKISAMSMMMMCMCEMPMRMCPAAKNRVSSP